MSEHEDGATGITNHHQNDRILTVITKIELVYPEAWRLIWRVINNTSHPSTVDLEQIIRQHLTHFPGADSGVIIDLSIRERVAR